MYRPLGQNQQVRRVHICKPVLKRLKYLTDPTFFRDLLSWVIPIFLFVGVGLFIMQRMQGRQPGFMTIGKNKAKIYVEDEVGVTFDDIAGVDENTSA